LTLELAFLEAMLMIHCVLDKFSGTNLVQI
jgi:hypothetical protein